MTDQSLGVQLSVYQTSINKLLSGQNVARDNFSDTSRSFARNVLVYLFQLGTVLLADENKGAYADLLAEKGVKTSSGDNPWTAVVHLAIADAKVRKTWVNRAPNLRAMAYFCKDANKAKTWLEKLDLSDPDFRRQEDRYRRSVAKLVGSSKSTGINALLILDNAMQVHPTAPAVESQETLVDRALRAKVTLDSKDIEAIPDTRKVVMAWCRVEDGKLVVGGLVDDYKGALKAAAEAGRAIAAPNQTKLAAVLGGEPVGELVTVPTTTLTALQEAE